MSGDAALKVTEENTPDLQVSLQIELPDESPRGEAEAVDDRESEEEPPGYGFGV